MRWRSVDDASGYWASRSAITVPLRSSLGPRPRRKPQVRGSFRSRYWLRIPGASWPLAVTYSA